VKCVRGEGFIEEFFGGVKIFVFFGLLFWVVLFVIGFERVAIVVISGFKVMRNKFQNYDGYLGFVWVRVHWDGS